jgi:hypothetical protein
MNRKFKIDLRFEQKVLEGFNQNYTNKDNQESRGSTKMQKCVQKKLKDHSHVSEI